MDTNDTTTETSTCLQDIKKLLGPIPDEGFDDQICELMSLSLLQLSQVGCINSNVTAFTKVTKWEDIVKPPPNGDINIVTQAVKSVIYYNTKIAFDPPVSTIVQAYREDINQMLWRIEVAYDDE